MKSLEERDTIRVLEGGEENKKQTQKEREREREREREGALNEIDRNRNRLL